MKKTILVTGSTDGIGFETAKMLVFQGHQVLLHGRSAAKLQQAQQALLAQDPNAAIETYIADLSKMSDVKALASAILDKHTSLDVLINNAGVYSTPSPVTNDGFDLRFVVNTVAPYLLTKLLLPALGNTSRVVNLSSAAQATVSLDALIGKRKLSDGEAYAQSKLALTMWSRKLGLDQQSEGAMFVAVNPASMLGSKMVKEAYGVKGGDLSIGADILTRAALSDEFAQAHGQYFDNDRGRFSQPHPDALNDAKVAAVIDTLDQLIA